MTTPDYRALCAEMLKAWDSEPPYDDSIASHDAVAELLERARALLAAPEAVGVADEELLALRSWSSHGPTFDSDLVDFARAVLSNYAQPAPVPVGERLPGVGDCNDDGEVWIQEGGIQEQFFDESEWVPFAWVLREYESSDELRSAPWLPHWALPLPGDQP